MQNKLKSIDPTAAEAGTALTSLCCVSQCVPLFGLAILVMSVRILKVLLKAIIGLKE